MTPFLDYIFNNAYQQDAAEMEKHLREKYPLLLHKNEKIELAFRDRGGKGRDKEYFTSHRIILEDGKGVGTKRKNYKSIPYKSIMGFSIQTAGSLDGDLELNIWTNGIPHTTVDFSSANVDFFQLQQLLNTKVEWTNKLGTQDELDPVPPNMDQKTSSGGKLIDWFSDNAKQVETDEVDRFFKTEMPVLLSNEKVNLAFKSGRDTKIFTDKRLLLVNVKGLVGKKIEFTSILWKSVHAYSVQTAGAFLDRDTEMKLYTDIIGMDEIEQDFRSGKANLFGIQKSLCNHILGDDSEPIPESEMKEVGDQKSSWWFRDNQRPLDAAEMDKVYHSDPPLLQGSEHVEFAFKGRRDITMFTTKRLIMIDPQGLMGKKIQYLSVPWEKITAYAVRTAGKVADFDTEVCFWTEMDFQPGAAGGVGEEKKDNPPIPPMPYMSYFEIDFNKRFVDMHKLKFYLSKRLILLNKGERGAPISLDGITGDSVQPNAFERLWQKVGGDQIEIDANDLDQDLHGTTQILLDEEKVIMAFKAGRDISLFTNLRVMRLDVQGLFGQQVEYVSIPYRSIRSFSIETGGVWDRDTELTLYTRNRWDMAKVAMDFRSGKADITQINKFLCAVIIGYPSDSKVDFGKKDYTSQAETNMGGGRNIGAAFFDNSKEVDAQEMDTMLRSSPPFLLAEEKVLRAFKQARDMFVYTNRRIIFIDTQGLSGKRVNYRTIPFRSIKGYEFETHGHLDRDAELYAYTDIAEVRSETFPRIVPCEKTKQSILVKKTDIYEMGKLFTDHVLFGKEYPEEPEISF